MTAGPLAGLRIVELGGMGPVPFCGLVLSDLGADVVRIHRPAEIDRPGNPVLGRGRRSLVADLKTADGVMLVKRLIDRSDAMIEGFRPGVADRLGFDSDALRAVNPRLVVGRMTGYGQTGPAAQRAGHDINYLAASGVLGALGTADAPPLPPLNLLGDFGGGGMLLAVGVLAAVLQARISGAGQDVDAAMVDGSALMMAMTYGMLARGTWPRERGTSMFSGVRPYYTTYRCADQGFVAVGASEPPFFRALVAELGLSDVIDVARQTDPSTWDHQRTAFANAFAARPRDEWGRRFADVDACVTPVLSPDEAPDDVHLAARKTFVRTTDGHPQPAPAPRFSATPTAAPRPASSPGEDTDAVLTELGVTAEEIAPLRATGVVA
ncbi:CaiB/BaiF CoA transferase family protein [Cryptosporangium sp. NPDC051539]|uniref:CaiB/BaiF CoA transferase family protein n=1 Tax=Cryptosporangium sp. NPDC051539 TaxID=3363962 RepID=UPI0037B1BBAF